MMAQSPHSFLTIAVDMISYRLLSTVFHDTEVGSINPEFQAHNRCCNILRNSSYSFNITTKNYHEQILLIMGLRG